MARPRIPHPLGKCAEERIEITMPAEMKQRLAAVALLEGKTPTAWARDTLEKAIEGAWIFIQRRVSTQVPADQEQKPPEE